MKSRVFIGINLTEKVKKKLIQATEKWQELPIKWVPEANLHVTLAFLGWIYNDLLPDICRKARKIAENKEIIELEFEKIALGPENSPAGEIGRKPNMIWLWGKINPELLEIVQTLEKELGLSGIPRKTFRPHITLGRIRAKKWEALNPAPEINEKFSLTVSAESIDVMASEFVRESHEYTLLESCPLS